MIRIVFNDLKDETNVFGVIYELISEAKRRVLVEVFAVSNEEIINILKRKEKEGLDVRLLLDFNSENEKVWVKNGKASWRSVRFGNNKIFWTYHLKMAIVDDVVVFGSPNWSFSGLVKNREGVIITDEPEIVSRCLSVFEADWLEGVQDIRALGKRGKFFSVKNLKGVFEKIIRVLRWER